MGHVSVNPHAHVPVDKFTQTWENVGTLPALKTPEERGPLGAWAYDSRDRLGLSVEQVAIALPKPVNPATIRKAESDSRNMSRPLWRALTDYYRAVAADREISLDALPPSDAADEPQGDLTALLTTQNAYLARITIALEKLAGISPDPEPQLSPADSTVLRSIARSWEPAPTTSRESPPEEVAR